MKTKVQVQAQAIRADEPSKRDSATLIIGLVLTAVFVAMLTLNALS